MHVKVCVRSREREGEGEGEIVLITSNYSMLSESSMCYLYIIFLVNYIWINFMTKIWWLVWEKEVVKDMGDRIGNMEKSREDYVKQMWKRRVLR